MTLVSHWKQWHPVVWSLASNKIGSFILWSEASVYFLLAFTLIYTFTLKILPSVFNIMESRDTKKSHTWYNNNWMKKCLMGPSLRDVSLITDQAGCYWNRIKDIIKCWWWFYLLSVRATSVFRQHESEADSSPGDKDQIQNSNYTLNNLFPKMVSFVVVPITQVFFHVFIHSVSYLFDAIKKWSETLWLTA